MHLEAKTTFVPSRNEWHILISISTAGWTRDLTGNQEAEALAGMVMSQHLLSHQHVRSAHSFTGPAPSSPPATTKVSINYLFLLLSSILACFSWGVGGNGFGGLSGFFVLHWKVSSWWTPLMTINNGRRIQQNAVISFRSKTMHSTLHSKAKGSKKNMLNVGLKTTKGIAYSEKETMPHAITYRKHHTMLH